MTVLAAGGQVENLPLLGKAEVAAAVLERAIARLRAAEPDWIAHLCPAADWQAAQSAGVYRGDTLASQGFIHFSGPGQVLDVANTFYAGREDLVVLWVDPARLQAELRWEFSDGQLFPHLYGPLNLDAVSSAPPCPPGPDGSFRRLPAPP